MTWMKGITMKTQLLRKLSVLCLVLVIGGAAWACGGKGGGCGDKDKKAQTQTVQCDRDKKGDCDKTNACDKKADDKGGGCKGGGSGTKDCPKK
jgi:hypothetical protein